MSDLQKYYQEKYGKPAKDPVTVASFQEGAKLGAAFIDELAKLNVKAAAAKKEEGAK